MWLDQLIKAHGLRCAAGNFADCELKSEKCKTRKGWYLNRSWSGCPVRAVLDDPRMSAALQIERQAKISPISNWPDGYSAWLPEYVLAIADAREERASSKL